MRNGYLYALVLFVSVAVVAGAGPGGPQPSGRTDSPISITINSQRIIRGGPHPFREVKATLVNTGVKPIAVLGRKRERAFTPAGDAVEFDADKQTWPPGRPTLTATDIADEAPDRQTLKPGKTLEFVRTFSPSSGGKKIRIEAYYAVDRTSKPLRVMSDAFDLN